MLSVKKFIIVFCYLLLTGCTVQSLTWDNTESLIYQTDVPKDKASIIVYRELQAIEGNAVNIYINGEYLTSLQPNAYSQYNVCPHSQRLYSEFTGNDPGYKNKAKLGSYYDLGENQLNFFKVINLNGHPTLQAVSEQQAKVELKQIPKQVNTLPRVEEKNCEKIKHYNLSASALFAFNSGNRIIPYGEQEIAKIAEDIKVNQLNVNYIEVIGYTDPVGKSSYNKTLSLQRAETIKSVLVQNNISASIIKTEGRGAENLLVAHCDRQYPQNKAKQNECNQPNRRVEVILHLANSH